MSKKTSKSLWSNFPFDCQGCILEFFESSKDFFTLCCTSKGFYNYVRSINPFCCRNVLFEFKNGKFDVGLFKKNAKFTFVFRLSFSQSGQFLNYLVGYRLLPIFPNLLEVNAEIVLQFHEITVKVSDSKKRKGSNKIERLFIDVIGGSLRISHFNLVVLGLKNSSRSGGENNRLKFDSPGCPKLRHLILDGVNIDNLEKMISETPNLEKLEIIGPDRQTIPSMSSVIPKLKELKITNDYHHHVTRFSSLSFDLPILEKLSLTLVSNFEEWKSFPYVHLRSLELIKCRTKSGRLDDLIDAFHRSLASNPFLESISFFEEFSVDDGKPSSEKCVFKVEKLYHLRELRIGCKKKNAYPIHRSFVPSYQFGRLEVEDCPRIRILEISQISQIHISSSSSAELKFLSITRSLDIELKNGLKHFNHLQSLIIRDCSFENVEEFSNQIVLTLKHSIQQLEIVSEEPWSTGFEKNDLENLVEALCVHGFDKFQNLRRLLILGPKNSTGVECLKKITNMPKLEELVVIQNEGFLTEISNCPVLVSLLISHPEEDVKVKISNNPELRMIEIERCSIGNCEHIIGDFEFDGIPKLESFGLNKPLHDDNENEKKICRVVEVTPQDLAREIVEGRLNGCSLFSKEILQIM